METQVESILYSNWWIQKGAERQSRGLTGWCLQGLSNSTYSAWNTRYFLTRCFRSHWMTFQFLQLQKPERWSHHPHHLSAPSPAQPSPCVLILGCIPKSITSPSSQHLPVNHSKHLRDNMSVLSAFQFVFTEQPEGTLIPVLSFL